MEIHWQSLASSPFNCKGYFSLKKSLSGAPGSPSEPFAASVPGSLVPTPHFAAAAAPAPLRLSGLHPVDESNDSKTLSAKGGEATRPRPETGDLNFAAGRLSACRFFNAAFSAFKLTTSLPTLANLNFARGRAERQIQDTRSPVSFRLHGCLGDWAHIYAGPRCFIGFRQVRGRSP